MKIVYLAAYFYPEKYASDEIYTSILEELAKLHQVHVIAPQPSRGVLDEEFLNYCAYEVKNGIHIHRFPMYREAKSALKRILRYKKCEKGYKKIAKTFVKADYVFAASTPPTMGILAGKIAKKLEAKFIYSLQDVFPDSLISTGFLKKTRGPIWWLGRKIEKKTYKSAEYITVISRNFYNNLLDKKVPKNKLRLIPNWIDLDKVVPIKAEDNKLFEELNLSSETFKVVYAGNMGAAQGAEIILDVAEQLKTVLDIQFIIFGGGSGYQDFVCAVKDRRLHNIIVNPLLPKERISEVYNLGDVSLIICKKGAGKTALPSKTWSIMACNTPIVASFDTDSELAEIIDEAQAGVCVAPEDSKLLSEAILRVKDSRLEIGSRFYLQKRLSKNTLINMYLQLFV